MKIDRRGQTLLAMLWVVAAASAIAGHIVLAAQLHVRDARNGADTERAFWMADGCGERALATIDALLAAARSGEGSDDRVWRRLPRALDSSGVGPDCDVVLANPAARLDINAVDELTLRRLLQALRVSPAAAESLTAALLDWRDPDGDARPFGAESEWYVSRQRPPPRNGPLANLGELRDVRGYGMLPALDSLLGVESPTLDITAAPIVLLSSLTTLPPEVLARIVDARELQGSDPSSFDVASIWPTPFGLDPESDSLRGALRARLTTGPDAWLLTTRGRSGVVLVAVELRIVRAGPRAAVVRRRVWWS